MVKHAITNMQMGGISLMLDAYANMTSKLEGLYSTESELLRKTKAAKHYINSTQQIRKASAH